MKIEQEKTFKPVIITLETKIEYEAFIAIVDEADSVRPVDTIFMNKTANDLAKHLSNYFTNN